MQLLNLILTKRRGLHFHLRCNCNSVVIAFVSIRHCRATVRKRTVFAITLVLSKITKCVIACLDTLHFVKQFSFVTIVIYLLTIFSSYIITIIFLFIDITEHIINCWWQVIFQVTQIAKGSINLTSALRWERFSINLRVSERGRWNGKCKYSTVLICILDFSGTRNSVRCTFLRLLVKIWFITFLYKSTWSTSLLFCCKLSNRQCYNVTFMNCTWGHCRFWIPTHRGNIFIWF